MNEDMIALAREAVTSPRWRWMSGMRTAVRPSRIKPSITIGGRRVSDDRPATPDDLPDFDDPATVGCLEALIQELYDHDGRDVIVDVRWAVGTDHRVVRWVRTRTGARPETVGGYYHPSKVAALVTALKAAP